MKARWNVVLILLCLSCRQPAKKTDENVIRIAALECRAIRLREQRFEVANKIRFAQDTLLQLKSVSDTIRLNDSLTMYLLQKEEVLKESLQLADTIHRQLDSLRKFVFKNVDDKHSFDEALKTELQNRSCLE